MGLKCKDCGKTPYEPSHILDSICSDCWDLRGELINGLNEKKVSIEDFRRVQNIMNHRNYMGAAAIREALGLDQPQI